ncbi:hypothetical protein [Duganella sp. sic0402]|uniref:hypothetical protein n=1 Tax=Duganella sp. sic0402 TaxID=2854786 RepID=UPI001E5BC508|nr:hypothetical protein [Duganella sp. sic0402]
MELSKQSSRKLVVAGVATTVIALGLAAWFSRSPSVETQVTVKAQLTPPASASSAASVKKPAPAAAPHRPAEIKDPVPPGEPPAIRTKDQGAAALMALPELQAWSAAIEKNSGGKAHGGLLEYDPAPRKLNGKSYWQFSFVENSAEAAQRWESFLVSSSDDEILVEDATSEEAISLGRWRREKHPGKRTAVDN